MKLNPSERIAHSTVRIECDIPGGMKKTGTGFFYNLNVKGDIGIPVIVTNKHVVKEATKGRFILTLQTGNGAPNVGTYHEFELDSFEKRWIPHPNHNIDLCVLPIAPLIRAADKKNMKVFYAPFDKMLIPNASDIEEMVGLDNITMVGYPNGLWDKKNNQPIFRKGVLATSYKYDWNGNKEFLIDAACFPGSSGSPVMLFDIGSHQSRHGFVVGSHRIKLLGILYAGPQYTVEGDIEVIPIPTKHTVMSVSKIPINLGIIIKAEQLLAFEDILTY